MTKPVRAWFEGSRVLVVGLARSGYAAAKLLVRHGCNVRGVDRRHAEDLGAVAQELRDLGAELHFGSMNPSELHDRDLVVVSPGVPLDLPLFTEAERRGIPIAAEVELGFGVARAPIVAVTGTNGKSTTVELLGAVGKAAGRKTEVLGNIGTALSERAESVPADGLLVVEISSFQLEACTRFHPKVGVLLNVTPDHLDRHRNMEHYAGLKGRLFEFQNEEEFRVQPLGDARIELLLRPMKSRPLWFGFADPTGDGVWLEGGSLRFRFEGRAGSLIRREEAALPGPHNTENMAAAAAAALAVGISERAIAKAFREFRGLPHRLTLVAEIDGVRYVNDSKATNVDALRRALESFSPPVTLIAGGRDKDGDFAAIRALVMERVRHAVYVGEAASKLEQSWPDVPHERTPTLEDAVHAARARTPQGGVVLLSPGCASYDMFRNFEERGARFEAAVLEMKRSLAKARR
ncbi:MAG: UDP-N-acetylmuramoyl-L-alanine--D-glutamate ligase [Candidatus Eisenbacteria bacterium]|uniref:UDP-N-acetylmuramoylalanine--D-glutamate ligase n=1 Tax=Eiseniibacteriota bacterium TaxID=2212470 RepID=A0A538T7Y2_UNCEI|nr:MAG: UDP-N-acetylmuramoyl-L-alanine--D-glutamate ligase [Candidatus Eisenbacteria bacterium]